MTKSQLHRIVFRTDTKAGRRFDVALLWLILASALAVIIESVPGIGIPHLEFFLVVEWIMTILFTIEYLIRIWISPKPIKYIFSFWGLIDLLSIIPSYASLFFFSYHYFIIIRIFRLLRVFRILKLARFNSESIFLIKALKASAHKLGVFLMAVLSIVVIMGTVMYVAEGGEKGYTSIPQSIYWAIVTITTVGYGDMVPQTAIGKIISSVAMITGYAIIAVPTGIITLEMTQTNRKNNCSRCDHANKWDANFCNNCGQQFQVEKADL